MNKQPIKINLKTFIIIVVIILLILFLLLFYFISKTKENIENSSISAKPYNETVSNTRKCKYINS